MAESSSSWDMKAIEEAAWSSNTVIGTIVVAVICTFAMEFLLPRNSRGGNDENDPDELQGPYLTYTKYSPSSSFWSDLKVLKAMWFSKITGDDLQERLNSFYESQADLYDSYRIRMLHGRPIMLQHVARHLTVTAQTKKKGVVWVDLACGTGYNVESYKTCLDKFRNIYLLDLCVPLCDVAQRDRADRYNTSTEQQDEDPKIVVIHGDATDFECKGLPDAETADLVTITYSLVMIPDWKKAIENAKRLLKPGGLIAVCDFTVGPNDNKWMKQFWKHTFASDHVYLNEEHITTLHKEFDVIVAGIGYGPLPYTPIFLQPAYYSFVGRKKKN
jgi:S-adenosylmethionine-diacylgycerolhomoserine-N-methlytransferase